MPATNFQGLSVLTLESRRGREMARLIETYGGKPIHAPAMREVPLSSNPAALKFAEALFQGELDVVIFLTGAGARALLNVLETAHCSAPISSSAPRSAIRTSLDAREEFFSALRKVQVIARGPKSLAVLREWNVPVALFAAEPNTWRELLQAVDVAKLDLRDKQIGVQEYGVSNLELLDGLRLRGARVMPVPVYQWALPEDTAPLRNAVDSIIEGRIDVVLFTTGVQVVHLFEIADQAGKRDALKAALTNVVKAAIGPATAEALSSFGLGADLQASHPKMGFLVKEAAEQSPTLLRQVRSHSR